MGSLHEFVCGSCKKEIEEDTTQNYDKRGSYFIPDAKFDALAGLAETLSIPMPAMVGIFAGVMGVATAVTLTRDINSYSRKQLMEYQEIYHIRQDFYLLQLHIRFQLLHLHQAAASL